MPRALGRVTVIDRDASGKARRFQTADAYSFDASQRKMTAENFMQVPGNISRIGIQEYTAKELGIEGSNRTIRLCRLPEEVFAADTLASFEHQTLTSGHPPREVDADSWRGVAAGDVFDVMKGDDGVNTVATLLFKDANAIDEVVTYGRDQLSCGYSFELDMTPGTFEGEAYDGLMRKIRGNHVAHVYAARGGPGLRVADEKKRKAHTMRTLVIDGISIDVEDNTQASIIEKVIAESKTKVTAADAARTAAETEATAAKAALAAGTTAAEAAKTAHDAKVKELEAKIVSDDKIDALVEEKIAALAGAKAIVGDSFDGKGKSVVAIRVEALDHVAKDAAAYPGVMAVLGGAKPSEAKPEIAKLAFDAAVAVRAAGGAGSTQRTGANDAAARAFAPAAGGGAAGAPAGARVIDYNARGAKPKDGSASA